MNVAFVPLESGRTEFKVLNTTGQTGCRFFSKHELSVCAVGRKTPGNGVCPAAYATRITKSAVREPNDQAVCTSRQATVRDRTNNTASPRSHSTNEEWHNIIIFMSKKYSHQLHSKCTMSGHIGYNEEVCQLICFHDEPDGPSSRAK